MAGHELGDARRRSWRRAAATTSRLVLPPSVTSVLRLRGGAPAPPSRGSIWPTGVASSTRSAPSSACAQSLRDGIDRRRSVSACCSGALGTADADDRRLTGAGLAAAPGRTSRRSGRRRRRRACRWHAGHAAAPAQSASACSSACSSASRKRAFSGSRPMVTRRCWACRSRRSGRTITPCCSRLSIDRARHRRRGR